MENLNDIKSQVINEIESATDLRALDEVRVKALGKKGVITEMMKGLSSLSTEEKKETGKGLNVLKNEMLHSFYESFQTAGGARRVGMPLQSAKTVSCRRAEVFFCDL